jgi:hypothetical protein
VEPWLVAVHGVEDDLRDITERNIALCG